MSVLKANYSTVCASAIADLLREHYAIGAEIDCRLLSRGFNDTYAVEADGERLVFRLSHPRARGPADVATETAFLGFLQTAGVPVAAAVAARTGALFISAEAFEGPRAGVLFRALPGRAPDPRSHADAHANGVTLARLHDAAATFDAPQALYRLDLDHLLWRPLERLKASRLVGDRAGVIDEIAARIAARVGASPLTMIQCHGDCHGQNAKIAADGTAAFFDFDDGGFGFLAYDLAVFLWAKVSFGRALHPVWRAFIDGYRSVRAIADADYEAVEAFVIVRHIWLLGEFASRADQWGSEQVAWVGDQVAFLENWEAERLRGTLFD